MSCLYSGPVVHAYAASYGNSDMGYGGSFYHDPYAMHQVFTLFNLFFNFETSNAMPMLFNHVDANMY